MHIAMLGYDYGLMPAYAGPQGYVRSPSYLGADAQTPAWLDTIKQLAQQGLDVAKAALEKKQAEAEAEGKASDAKIAENYLASIRAGQNPFAASSGPVGTVTLVAGGIAAVIILGILIKKRRR